jgi:hypothetical protein
MSGKPNEDWDELAKLHGLEGTEWAYFQCLDDEHKKQFLLRRVQDITAVKGPTLELDKGQSMDSQDKTETPQRQERDPKDVRVWINDIEVTEWVAGWVYWIPDSHCELSLRDLRHNSISSVLPLELKAGQKIQIYDRVIPRGDTPSWEGALTAVVGDQGTLKYQGFRYLISANEVTPKQDPNLVKDNLGQIYRALSKLDQSPWSFSCTPDQLAGSVQILPGGKLLLDIPGSGDDVLILYLPDRMTGKPEPVLRCKRWGELEVVAKWHGKMNELAQAFWRAVAHVHHALPLPVSDKQEAISAFCNKHHMTLAEFDRNYYARPVKHLEVMNASAVIRGIWTIEKIGK